MSGFGNDLRPCEVRLAPSRKRVAPTASHNGQLEPLPVQIKRKNCPYIYRKEGDPIRENNLDNQYPQNEPAFDAPSEPAYAAPSDEVHTGPKNPVNAPPTSLEEMRRAYPDFSAENWHALIKSSETSRNQASASAVVEPQTISCARIPMDWSLKMSLQVNVASTIGDDEIGVITRKCVDADAMARSVTAFADSLSASKITMNGDHSIYALLSALRAAAKMWSMSTISYMNNGAISRHALNSVEIPKSSGAEQSSFFETFAKEMTAKWMTGLLSVFTLTKQQKCPYFYVINERMAAIIASGKGDAPGEPSEGNPFSKLVASIAPAPPGLLSWLKNSKIHFASINEHGAEMPKSDGTVIQDSEEMEDDTDMDAQGDNAGEDNGETDSLSYFEELGVASMILENLKAEGKAKETKKQPLVRAVVIRGRAVMSLITLLCETRGFPDRAPSAAPETKRSITTKSDMANGSVRFPLPSIMAPVPFDWATLTSFRVKISPHAAGSATAPTTLPNANKNENGSLAIQFTGGLPLPPFVLQRLLSQLSVSGRTFTAQTETWQAKSQADHLNASLAMCSVDVDSNETNLLIDKSAPSKTFSAASFSSGFFKLPVSK